MWNESIKQGYLQTLPQNRKIKAERLFNKLCEYEKEHSTDIADMGIETFVEAIDTCNPQSYMMAFAMRRILLDYISWRSEYLHKPLEQNVAELFDPLSCSAIDDTVKHFRDFDDVYQCLLSVYRPTDGMLCYPIACLAWIGLTSEQVSALSNDDVDLESKTVFVKNRPITEFIEFKNKTIIELLRIYKNSVIGKRTQNRNFYVDLIDVGKFLKLPRSKNSQKDREPITGSSITRTLNTDFNAQYQRLYGENTHLTYEGIRMLGKINRLEELIDEFGSIRSIPTDKLYEYTQFSKTNWTVPMIEATLTAFKKAHNL